MYEIEKGKAFIAIGHDDWLDLASIVRIRRSTDSPLYPREAKAVITVKNDPMLITTEHTYDQVWGAIRHVMAN